MGQKERKGELRANVKERLNAVEQEVLTLNVGKIHEHFFALKEWQKAKTIGVTISVGREVDTYAILKKGFEMGKVMAAPKCDPQTRTLSFYEIASLSDLEDSFYGLKEPDPNKCRLLKDDELDFLLVPGLLFNAKGYRIGYGGGYYDRFLNKNRTIDTCSLCHPLQLSQELPIESHDYPVDIIITSEGIFRT
ncbi:5-formyltetrahydrofolate cyclo-ligase [Alteribacter populi]|uniref:5-formyltetrahydrofolate cyclo-ligase n=1 Tax=Alteribacter populi TaxID=2011011 RepID=UPI000BBA46A2|nr:5-formyltetrahydrofolate cyclo-ligase [Alteribacter populi]